VARIAQGQSLSLDTNCLIYLAESAGAVRGDKVARAIAGASGAPIFISAIALAETLGGPYKAGKAWQADLLRASIEAIPGMTVVDVGVDLAVHAARLRGLHGISLLDAIHLATAERTGAEVLLTNDRRIASLPGFERGVYLDELEFD